ncbi:hypothetical protein HII31_04547 [Pseudocercospora fuligena]|uniref:Uncharacterized protein n=1 Tax=Pseudocercospora fuligena TaxID=685502 RepID=A0A8H6RMF4_9PEZI|nr:hypothetical protein HII31_04547 [Pseudocercospora fuligena]
MPVMAGRDQRSKRFGTPYERRVTGGERIILGDITDGSNDEVRIREENAANIEAGNASSEVREENDNDADGSDAEQPATVATNEQQPTPRRTFGALPHRPLPRRNSNPPSITGTPTRTTAASGSTTRRTPTGPSPLLRQALTAASAPPASTSSQMLFDSLSAQLSNPIGLGRPQNTNAPINFANPVTSSASRPRSHSTFASSNHRSLFSAGRNRRLDDTADENTSPTARVSQYKRRRTQSSPMSPGRQAMQQEADEGEEDFQGDESMQDWRRRRRDQARSEDDDENDENDENMGEDVA